MVDTKKTNRFMQAVICSLALMIFSFFIQYDFPVRFISIAALLIPAWIISTNLKIMNDFVMITGEYISRKKFVFFTVTGILAGILLAVAYRSYLHDPLIPSSLKAFVLVAALIGSTEELVFRGFLQGFTQKISVSISIVFGTLSHTGYKCCLFLAPVISEHVNIVFLVSWTFGVGLAFGIIRHVTKSIWIPLAAHAAFDIIAYAEYIRSPWWVW